MNSKKQASSLLEEANKKKFGRKIKFDDLFEMAISLVTPEHLKMLQETSLTNENRRDRLQQKWIELHGPLTHDEFVGLTMTAEFFEFIKEHGAEAVPA